MRFLMFSVLVLVQWQIVFAQQKPGVKKNNPVAKNGISPGQKLTYLVLNKTRTTEKITINSSMNSSNTKSSTITTMVNKMTDLHWVLERFTY